MVDDIKIEPTFRQKAPNDVLVELNNTSSNRWDSETSKHYAYFSVRMLCMRHPLWIMCRYQNGKNSIFTEKPCMIIPTDGIDGPNYEIKIPTYILHEVPTVQVILFPCVAQDVFCMNYYRNPALDIKSLHDKVAPWIVNIATQFEKINTNRSGVNFAVAILHASPVGSLSDLQNMEYSSFRGFLNEYNAEFCLLFAHPLWSVIKYMC